MGGGHTFQHEVLAELATQGPSSAHQFTVLTRFPAKSSAVFGGLEAIALEGAMRELPARVRRRLGRSVDQLLGRTRTHWIERFPAVEALLAGARIDVIWYLTPIAWVGADIPYITIVWDLQHRLQPYFPEVTAGDEFNFRDETYTRLLRKASMVIVGTRAGSDEVTQFYGVAPERIRVLPHPTPGFALRAAEQPTPPRPAAAPPDPYLFYPAQFWPHKNHVNLLEALRLLRTRDGLPFHLALSGSDQGNQNFVRDTAARLGLTDAVHLLGFVEQADLVGLYRHAFALSYVTFFGPENLPTLEAFALGCPVVASDVSGAQEQLGDAALLVDPRRPDQIAAAIRRLHEDATLRATLVARGLERARRFTSRNFVAGVIAWLDDFASVRRCWPGSTP
jgi:glycosyltransferase involved in cell wall biosynthesis